MDDDKVHERAFDWRVSDDDPEALNALRALRRRHRGKRVVVVALGDDEATRRNPLRHVVDDQTARIASLEAEVERLKARLKRIHSIARDKG